MPAPLAAPAIHDAAVAAVFADYPLQLRKPLLALRELIFSAAAETPGVGGIVESLKWGQPAYLPVKPRVGTTIRIGRLKADPDSYAASFHCQTTLVDDFRSQFGNAFRFEGNRAILLSAKQTPDEARLRSCFARALSYHLTSK